MKTKFFLSLTLLAITVSLIFTGCHKDKVVPDTAEQTLAKQLAVVDQTQLAADLKVIDDSLAKWGITPMTEPNGVRYTIQTTGTGAMPKLDSYITITYKVKLLKNKSVVDQGTNIKFALTDLIVGWKTVLPLIPQGSKITLYVPSGLAYGSYERIDPIDHTVIMPANSNLIFDIDLNVVQ
jgi:FKBP-type peptidyl-prolyl cis-trans isomerase FkpA